MSDQTLGVPAFPSSEKNDDGTNHYSYLGMTMRDYFAASALHGLVANPSFHDGSGDAAQNARQTARLAKSSYEISDAMLAERAR